MSPLVGARIGDFAGSVLSSVAALPPLMLSLDDAAGCTLAEDIVANVGLPSFDRVAYDGYAVHLADVAAATSQSPVYLDVSDIVTSHAVLPSAVRIGTAVRVEVGARMPLNAEAVVPLDYTDVGESNVGIYSSAPLHAGVRPTGCEIAQGAVVLSEGDTLSVVQLMVLAAMGRREVLAFPRPRVVIVTTSELGPSGTATDGISHALSAGVLAAGGLAYRVGSVRSEAEELLTTLEDHLIRADLMLVVGGSWLGPQGARGVLPQVLSELGTVSFTPLAARPLGFVGYGAIGIDATPIFALPSDPAAALVAFETLVRPVIRVLAAGDGAAMQVLSTRLDAPITSARGICDLVPVSLSKSTALATVATPLIATGGHPPLSTLAHADGLAIVGEDVTLVNAGSKIDVMVFDKHAH